MVGLLAAEGLGRQRGREERRRLARAALRAGDVDRLLLCLGRLEGEAPRIRGGRADRFDDPAAVAERERDRKERGGGRPAVVRAYINIICEVDIYMIHICRAYTLGGSCSAGAVAIAAAGTGARGGFLFVL